VARSRAPHGLGPAAVLDNEAVQALARLSHPKHRRMVEVLHATARRPGSVVVVPTPVRVEAAVPRDSATTSGLGRLKVSDVELTGARADRAIALASGITASAVDATVAQCAEELAAAGRPVVVYTSDVADLSRLCAGARVAVRRV
jgi:hypothetical protein